MSRKNRLQKLANKAVIKGIIKVKRDGEETLIYAHRERKVRRAQARLDGKKWSDLTQHERLTL